MSALLPITHTCTHTHTHTHTYTQMHAHTHKCMNTHTHTHTHTHTFMFSTLTFSYFTWSQHKQSHKIQFPTENHMQVFNVQSVTDKLTCALSSIVLQYCFSLFFTFPLPPPLSPLEYIHAHGFINICTILHYTLIMNRAQKYILSSAPSTAYVYK